MATPLRTSAALVLASDQGRSSYASSEDPHPGPGVDLHDVATYYDAIRRVIDHFNQKVPRYQQAQRFYKGDVHEVFASDYIADILEATGDDYLCNFAGRVVDEVNNRLKIQSVLVRTPTDDTASPSINDSLDTSIGGDTGAATATLDSGPDPTAPSVFPADVPTPPVPITAGANQHTAAADAARANVLGAPTDTDPTDSTTPPDTTAADAVATAANNTLPPAPEYGDWYRGGSSTPGALVGTVPAPTDAATQALQLVWRRLWKANRLAAFFQKWIKKALVFGDGYALGWDDGQGGVTAQVLDPTTTCVIYDEQDEDVELFGARWFETRDNRRRMNLYYDNWLVKLISKPRSTGEQAEDYIPYLDPLDDIPDGPQEGHEAATVPNLTALGFPFLNDLLMDASNDISPLRIATALASIQTARIPTGQPNDDSLLPTGPNPSNVDPDGFTTSPDPNSADALQARAAAAQARAHLWPVPNPHGRQPIFHLPTTDDEPYGEPEHANAYGPQNAINKLIAVQMATADAQGFPSRWALQKSGQIDENAYDEDVADELPPDPHRGAIEDRPGTVNILKDVDQLIQLAAADPKGFLDPMLQYIKFMSFVTATPMSFYDALGQMPSDSTMRENNGPLIKKCAARKMVMTPRIESFVEFLFSILGIRDVVIHVQWAQSQMIDDLPGWQVLAGKLASGVPFDQVMQEAGYTESQIAGWPPPSAGFSARVLMVNQLAEAAQALAPAVVGQVLSAEQAQSLIETMINDIRNTPTDASSRTNVTFRA